MAIRPELLTHPNIPKPLHGTNPRSIMGKQWWDEKRQEAYAKNNYHCMACGCHKSQDRFHNWLEAHESYDIDYKNGQVRLNEIVALCHTCHNFIHSGRLLKLWEKGEVSTEDALYILNRGFWILKQNNLEPFWGTTAAYIEITNKTELIPRMNELQDSQHVDICQDWSAWHIVIDGVKHYGRFKSAREWQESYG